MENYHIAIIIVAWAIELSETIVLYRVTALAQSKASKRPTSSQKKFIIMYKLVWDVMNYKASFSRLSVLNLAFLIAHPFPIQRRIELIIHTTS